MFKTSPAKKITQYGGEVQSEIWVEVVFVASPPGIIANGIPAADQEVLNKYKIIMDYQYLHLLRFTMKKYVTICIISLKRMTKLPITIEST
jgi:hypothetical protein